MRSPDFKHNKTLADVVSETRRPRPLPDTGWAKVGGSAGFDGTSYFKNSWANVAGSSFAPASYYLSADGEVRLRGKITGGSAGTVAFTLPPEVRPEYAETFIVAVDGGGKAHVTVHPSGDVVIDSLA